MLNYVTLLGTQRQTFVYKGAKTVLLFSQLTFATIA
jgi:hypothetical protein